ncbi:hypothetical protein [Leptospira borgpetersenii]|nr:hypothetical protein [Leptospira borgpetersenii]
MKRSLRIGLTQAEYLFMDRPAFRPFEELNRTAPYGSPFWVSFS